jgi:glycosyltransferase involved in cell wall biosynthesis
MQARPRLKLCFIGWADHVHLERWAGYFARLGHEVSLISFSGRGNYPEGVRQYTLGLRRRGMFWKKLRIAYLLWRIKPDIVHVHWAHFASYVGAGWKGPVVVTAWGSDIYRSGNFSDHDWKRLVAKLRAAAAVTCDSNDQANAIRALTGRTDGVSVIQWGIDTEVFRPGSPSAPFAEVPSEPDRPVVLSIRNFVPLYNLETIVDAFALVLQEVPRAFLLMKKYNSEAGYVDAIRARIERLGIGHATGIVEQVPYERMPDMYRTAAVTVSVPTSDGTPMSLLEAMACGSVPIFSDLPSLREWVADGVNGYLVPPTDARLLADRILKVLSDPAHARAIAARNRELVCARASQAVHMGRMESLYEALAGSLLARDVVKPVAGS